MIAVVSDSHVPSRAKEIPEKFWDKIEKAEITVHAGDFDRKETFNALEEYSNDFYGVKGNCDFFEAEELEESHVFEHKGFRIGIYHGTGITPRGDIPTLKKIARKDLEVDILIHGHSHQEDIELNEGVLLLNPGSCTGAGGGSARQSNPTMMKLEVEDSVTVKLLEFEGENVVLEEKQGFDAGQLKNQE